MSKGTSKSHSRRNHRDLINSGNRFARRNVFHRRLACEMLEDRRMLGVLTWTTQEVISSSVTSGNYSSICADNLVSTSRR